jgi:hypothetical protein
MPMLINLPPRMSEADVDECLGSLESSCGSFPFPSNKKFNRRIPLGDFLTERADLHPSRCESFNIARGETDRPCIDANLQARRHLGHRRKLNRVS